MIEGNLLRQKCNFMRQRSFGERSRVSRYPIRGVSAHPDAALALKNQCFPCADGREEHLVLRLSQLASEVPANPIRIVLNPQPDLCIQENFQSRMTSQSSGSLAGEIMSR